MAMIWQIDILKILIFLIYNFWRITIDLEMAEENSWRVLSVMEDIQSSEKCHLPSKWDREEILKSNPYLLFQMRIER